METFITQMLTYMRIRKLKMASEEGFLTNAGKKYKHHIQSLVRVQEAQFGNTLCYENYSPFILLISSLTDFLTLSDVLAPVRHPCGESVCTYLNLCVVNCNLP